MRRAGWVLAGVVAAALCAALCGVVRAESASVLLEEGVYEQDVAGDLDRAMAAGGLASDLAAYLRDVVWGRRALAPPCGGPKSLVWGQLRPPVRGMWYVELPACPTEEPALRPRVYDDLSGQRPHESAVGIAGSQFDS